MHVDNNDRYLLKILLAGCNEAIARKWCRLEPPTTKDGNSEMEILTHRLRTQEELYKLGKMDILHFVTHL